MTVTIDDAKFHQILDALLLHQRINPEEILPVVKIVQLAASVDLDGDPIKERLLSALTLRLCALGGVPIEQIGPLSPVPGDDEGRAMCVAAIGPQLTSRGARELAYALAYLVIVADLELAPHESVLLEQIRGGLAIPGDRADAIVETVACVVTPGTSPPATGAFAESRL